ncbi:MAG: DNRLRE domain-containing protein [Clostridia bacterium]|jgi:uncharacterized protein YjdB|nr:DNRLRE domain-containing protein [Clostridia bacterium]
MKKKRIIVGLLAVIMCCSVAAAGCKSSDPGPGPGPEPNPPDDPIQQVLGIDTWVESSYVNVFRDFTIEEDDARKANFVTAKNEYESVQIVLRSSKTFTIEDVQFTDLTCGSNTIDKSNLKYNYVEYVRAVFNSPNVAESSMIREAPESFPDALSNEKTVEVDALDAQPIWVTLYVPKTTEAGTYTGKVTVVTNKGNIDVPVNAEVNDVVVPDAGSDESQYNIIFWQLMIGGGFGKTYADSHASDTMVKHFGCERWTDDWWKIVGDIADVMKENRLNTLYLPTVQLLLDGGSVRNEDGTWTFNFSKFDEYIQFFLDRGVVNRFMGYMMMTGGNTNCIIREADGRSCTGTIKFDSADSDAWFDAYLPALYAHLHEKGWDTRWTQCLRDEPPTDSASVTQYKRLASIYKTHMKEIPFGDPTQTNENSQMLLEMNAPTLIPLIAIRNDHPSWYANLDENQRVYTYSCVVPQTSYLNRFIDMPVYYGRSIAWWNYNVGANGYLHWGLMAWYRPITDFALGDTATMYPDVANNTVKSSIRMANLRDGAEEYELLKLLAKDDLNSAKMLADMVAADAKTSYCQDTEELAKVREMLIHALGGKSGIVGKPESVTIAEESLSLLVTENAKLTATLLPEDSISKDLVWTSSNPDVVTVNAKGEVWANAAGEAVITVACKDYPEVKDTVTVTVSVPDPSEKVVLTSYKDANTRGGTFADYRYGSNSYFDVSKSTADNTYNGYMAFDATGFKSGVKKVVIRVYASQILPSASRTLALYACPSDWSETTLSYNTAPVSGNKITELVVKNDTGKTIDGWLEFDVTEYYNTLEDGILSVCVADITGTASDNNRVRISTRESNLNRPTLIITGENMNYAPEAVTGINVDTTLSLQPGDHHTLRPSVLPAGAPQQRYKFECADTSIVTVSATGVVTALKEGIAKITIICLDNPSIKAECNVTVAEDGRHKIFFATDDATIESHRPDMNFGAQGSFLTNFKDPKRRVVVQFNVTGLTQPVASVRMRLYVTLSGMAASNEFKVYVNNGTFTEGNVTYSNAPKTGKEVGSYTVSNAKPAIYGGVYDWITVELDPSCIAGDGTVSFTLVATGGDRVNFSSRQSGECPILEIDYGEPVTSIELTDKEIDRPGMTVNLEAVVAPATNHQAITYTSSDPTIATVDANGVVTGVAAGRVTITATSGAVSATCEVTVNDYINITSFTLSKTELTLKPTELETLTAKFAPEDANWGMELVWESSDPNVVSVTAAGIVVGRLPGTATVTAKSKAFPEVTATCNVTVQAKENTAVFTPTKDSTVETHTDKKYGTHAHLYTYTNPDRYAVLEFATEQLKSAPIGLSLKLYVQSTLNVDSTTEVYLATGKAWDEATIDRTNAPAKTGGVLGSLLVGKSTSGWVEIDIDPSVLPEEGGTLTLILWNKSGAGTYYFSKDSNYAPTLIVNYGDPVTAIEAENVEIDRPGKTLQLQPAITPATNHRPITFVSENPEIATVDANGVVTGVSVGEATITISSGSVSTTCTVTVNDYINITSFTLSKTELTLAPTASETLSMGTFAPDNANWGMELVWESSDPDIAYVFPTTGQVVARLPGTAVITASSKEFPDVKATCTVTVQAAEHTAVFNPTKDSSVETHIDSLRGTNNQLYTSANGQRYSVLEFDVQNIPSAAIGVKLRLYIANTLKTDNTIQVYLADDKAWDEATIGRANAPQKTGSAMGSLAIKSTDTGWVEFTLNKAVVPANGKVTFVLWVSKGTSGIYFAAREGNYRPTLIVDYGEAVTDIALSDMQTTAGLTYRLVPQVTPSENHEMLYYSSSDEAVATIDENGMVKALGAGTATITVRNTAGTVSNTCTVTVSAVPENQRRLNPILDATLNGSSGAGTNYGTNNNIHTIKSSNMHFLIMFDLSGIEGNITKLILRMQLNNVGAPSQTLGLYYAPTTAIAENAVKYNTWNGVYGDKIMEYVVAEKIAGDIIEIEIDPAVLANITDGKLGIVFKLEDDNPDTARCSFWSKEETTNVTPMLIVEAEPSGEVTPDPTPETEETV